MGKKRIVKKGATGGESGAKGAKTKKLSRKKLEKGVLYINATYNNTQLTLADTAGGVVAWSSSGSLGFRGAKKGTPFAAAQIGDLLGEQAKQLGLKEFAVIITGVGSGRESAVRSFMAKSGARISKIQDRTPVPFNGPRAPKPRRV